MWKVLLLLACVAGFTIVYCDDSADSYDDFDSIDTSYRAVESSSKMSETSSSSSSSSSLSSLSSTSGSKTLKSSKSSASMSASSESESSSKKITDYSSKKKQTIDSDDDVDSESNDAGPAEVETKAEVSIDASDDSQSCDGDNDTTGGSTYKCGPNQVFSNCTNGGCDARNCSQAGKPVPCVKLDPKNCIKGCVCKPGYLRTRKGNCVPKNECREGCGYDPNAHPGCGVNCGQTCEKRKICPRICKVDGCDCNENFLFDSNLGKCVSPKECTPICGINEVFSSCINGGCGYKNCSQIGKPKLCVDPAPGACKKGCVCASGYLRTANGTCVPQNQCPKSDCNGDPNAHPGCGVNCGRTCSTYKLKGVACPAICNLNGCDCNEGYVYDDVAKKCVSPENCTPQCGLNEVVSSCAGFGCGYTNCSQIGQPQLCIDPAPGACKKGCVCASGYLRAANGTCIPQDQCPKPVCNGDPNAHSGCGVNCGRTCATYKLKGQVACPAICYPNGCDCNDGYVYDNIAKKCVLPENCVGCGGDPNAQPGCGYNCGKTCSTYKINKQLACPRIQCKPDKCDCKDGYVLDKNINKCVLIKDCTPQCGLNEVLSSCAGFGCGYTNCSQIGQPQLCIDPAPGACKKGCVCASGYLRAANGTCIPQDQCPKPVCNGDPNAHPGCGVNCGRTCATYKLKGVACPAICNLNGCDCNEGYVYDDIAKKCVLPDDCDGCGGDPNAEPGCGYNCGSTCSSYKINKDLCPRLQCKPDKCDCKDGYVLDKNVNKCVLIKDCTPQCGSNEVYSNCTNGGCGHRNCSQIGQPQICIDRTPESCTKGCICSSGYLRAANGTCVLEAQCPVKGCNGDPSAHPGCGVNCGKTCETYKTKPVACPLICKVGGCDCNDGYVYDSVVKKCVLPKNCTPKCDKPNEVYDVCIAPCPPRRCDVDDRLIKCAAPPKPGDPSCKAGCRCADGYARNATGTCVLRAQCEKPLTCNRPNEYYASCPAPCPGDSCDVNPALVLCLVGPNYGDPDCKPACRCIDGYARNANKDCVPRDQCTPKSDQCPGQNEFFDTCISGCSNQSCYSIGKIFHCPIQTTVCRTGCRCKKGFYRNSDKVCVPQSECPPKTSTKPPVIPITSTLPPTTVDDNNNGGNPEDALKNLLAGVSSFTGKFLYDRMQAGKGQNIIASPFSVFTPLTQLFLYTDGEAYKQLASVLNVSSKQSIRSAFPRLVSSYEGQTSVNFTTACKTYSDKKYLLSDAFKKDSVDVVHAEAQELDFSQNTQAAQIINSWVEGKTNNKIKDLIKPSDLSALTRLVLVNAIYFKGDWLNKFNKDNTKEADFYLKDGTTKKTKLMYQQAQFNYGEIPDLNCKALEMPYLGKNFSMLIVLPNEKDGVMQAAKNLQNTDNFNKITGSLRSQKVKVYIPPFEINTDTDLATILKQAGITKIFDTKDSGLSGMLKKPEQIYVSKAIQKAYLKVDETGSEAAAANGIVVGMPRPGPPPPPPVEFRADHAFLFYIRIQATTMFCGAYVQ